MDLNSQFRVTPAPFILHVHAAQVSLSDLARPLRQDDRRSIVPLFHFTNSFSLSAILFVSVVVVMMVMVVVVMVVMMPMMSENKHRMVSYLQVWALCIGNNYPTFQAQGKVTVVVQQTGAVSIDTQMMTSVQQVTD